MKVFISAAIALAAVAVAPTQAALPANVQALIDPSIDPCTDFYQYACGSWLKANPLTPNQVSKDYSFTGVADRNELVIQDIVKEDWPLVGEFWDSCRDQKALETLGNKPLQPLLGRITQAGTREALLNIAGELSRSGIKFITDYDVGPDYKDAKNNILTFGSPSLTLPDNNYYYDDAAFASIEPQYRTYISTVLTLANFNPGGSTQNQASSASLAKYYADTVIAIEKKLAFIFDEVSVQTGDDAYYNPTTVGELMDKYPVAIGAYVKGAGFLDKSKLTKSSKVIVNYFDYIQVSEKVLASIDIRDLRTYLAFLYINDRARYLNNDFYNAWFQFFSKTLNGQQARSSTDSVCTFRVKQFFPDLIGKYYFMKMFDNERLENTQLLTKLIENAMEDHINKIDWLDQATRIQALGKLGKVANLIGQSKVKQSYPFYLSRDTFFSNIQQIVNSNFDKLLAKLGNPVNRDLWSISPAEVNAYYSPLENKMVFPAAILQAPFFDGKAHPAQNFGSIGAVIGHELTHGFDSSGSRFDGDGNKRNWWTTGSLEAFRNRTKCLENQYSNFTVTGENGKPLINVLGKLTLGENIADNGGFSLTWDAYHEYAKATSVPSGVTPVEADQTLFLSFAQTWCGISRDATMKNQVLTDVHSPGEWRANGVAINNEHFAKTFNCPAGARMNPVEKCKIW